MTELELCPTCKKGHLRPLSQVATDAEATEPFRKTGETRKYECDNPECEMHKSNVVINEYIPISESLSMKIKRVGEKEFHEP